MIMRDQSILRMPLVVANKLLTGWDADVRKISLGYGVAEGVCREGNAERERALEWKMRRSGESGADAIELSAVEGSSRAAGTERAHSPSARRRDGTIVR